MGNQLKKEYNFLEEPSATGGLDLRWRLYPAVDKQTNAECTIFMLDKKSLPKNLRNENYYSIFRNSVNRGIKFKHPNTLNILKPLLESSSTLAFVSEKVVGSLANYLGDDNNIGPNGKLDDRCSKKFSDLELKLGISQLCDGLLFLHRDAHIIHGFMDPVNIYITPDNNWKIFGFGFIEHISSESEEIDITKYDYTDIKQLVYLPSFNCLAPECIISSILTVKSDVFSLGRIIYFIHKFISGIRPDPIIKTDDMFRKFINSLSINSIHTSGIPNDLISSLKLLLECNEKLRISLNEFQNTSKYLNSMVVKVIRYLDNILKKELKSKIEFLKKLPNVMNKFDKEIIITKIIPPINEVIKDKRLIIITLPVLLKISEILNTKEFQKYIQPLIIKFFSINDPPDLFYNLILNLDKFTHKCNIEIRREQIVPMIVKGLEIRNVAIQISCLQQIIELSSKNLFEFRQLRNIILPKVRNICNLRVATNNPKIKSLRIRALICLAKIFKNFDNDTVKDVILQSVWDILSITKEPGILMAALGVCKDVGEHCNSFIIANIILPKLIPLSMENNLSLKQYKLYCKVIKDLFSKTEKYRIETLERKTAIKNTLSNDNKKNNIEKSFDNMDTFLNNDDKMSGINTQPKSIIDDNPFSNDSNNNYDIFTENKEKEVKKVEVKKEVETKTVSAPVVEKKQDLSSIPTPVNIFKKPEERNKNENKTQNSFGFDTSVKSSNNSGSMFSGLGNNNSNNNSSNNIVFTTSSSSNNNTTNSGNMFGLDNNSNKSSNNNTYQPIVLGNSSNNMSNNNNNNSSSGMFGLNSTNNNNNTSTNTSNTYQPIVLGNNSNNNSMNTSSKKDIFSGLGTNNSSNTNNNTTSNISGDVFSGLGNRSSTSNKDVFSGLSSNTSNTMNTNTITSNTSNIFSSSNTYEPISFGNTTTTNSNNNNTNSMFNIGNNNNNNNSSNNMSMFGNNNRSNNTMNTNTTNNNSNNNTSMFSFGTNNNNNSSNSRKDMFSGLGNNQPMSSNNSNNNNNNSNMFTGLNNNNASNTSSNTNIFSTTTSSNNTNNMSMFSSTTTNSNNNNNMFNMGNNTNNRTNNNNNNNNNNISMFGNNNRNNNNITTNTANNTSMFSGFNTNTNKTTNNNSNNMFSGLGNNQSSNTNNNNMFSGLNNSNNTNSNNSSSMFTGLNNTNNQNNNNNFTGFNLGNNNNSSNNNTMFSGMNMSNNNTQNSNKNNNNDPFGNMFG